MEHFVTFTCTDMNFGLEDLYISILIAIPNSKSAPGIAELQQNISSFHLVTQRGESSKLCSTAVKISPQSPGLTLSRAGIKRCSLTKRLKGIKNEVWYFKYNMCSLGADLFTE